MNPLPVGFCAAVHLTLRDSTGADVPRNPQGQRITLADFDMTVASPDGSVVGQRIDASHWSVCACQSGAPGTVATITASYPAQTLPTSARVPGTAIETTARFELAPPKGTVNPPGCESPGTVSTSTAATRAPQPNKVAATVQPVSPTVLVTSTPAPAPSGPVGQVIPKGAIGGRVLPYKPAPVSVNLDIIANGSWYVPSPVAVALNITANGWWYVPAPVAVTFDISATGIWIELTKIPVEQIQPTARPR
jgi:hypothetical protein